MLFFSFLYCLSASPAPPRAPLTFPTAPAPVDLPTPCAPTSKMTVNATVVGSPREHSDVPTPHNTAQARARLAPRMLTAATPPQRRCSRPGACSDAFFLQSPVQIFLNITNVGTMGVNLATGFHVPIRFSWAVQNWGGDWVASPQSNFTIGCWGAFVFTAIGTSNWKSLCGPQLQFKARFPPRSIHDCAPAI